MDDFRIVRFQSPDDFLVAASQRDDSSTNFSVGAVLECKIRDGETWAWDSRQKTLIGIYKGTELL